ncbi:hypothetical protein B0H13DRAFT_2395133 [Mycena leptocephala]|nr:hypothetical protein B0H13DRAFT_2395133 [Mycena leptocephala]
MACWKCGAVPTDGDSSSAAPGLSSIDLDHLLATNDAPTDFETAIIQDYITNGRRRVDHLTAEINALRVRGYRLIRERNTLAEHCSPVSQSPIARSSHPTGADLQDIHCIPGRPTWRHTEYADPG